MNQSINRCPWCLGDEAMQSYHDTEWGVPACDDRKLFEFLVLETAQAGLSWKTILHRRAGYRAAFAQFDPQAVARFDDDDSARLLADAGIIRNRAKIKATIGNARAFLRVQALHGSFAAWQWRFVNGTPIIGGHRTHVGVPATSALSDQIAKELKSLGFSFVGSTVLYAHMEACGMINDHLVDCFRFSQVTDMAAEIPRLLAKK